jgi:hypothetical protein
MEWILKGFMLAWGGSVTNQATPYSSNVFNRQCVAKTILKVKNVTTGMKLPQCGGVTSDLDQIVSG